ncbi:MAG: hypothetical protein R3B98_02625 [Hyphomonas sp.]
MLPGSISPQAFLRPGWQATIFTAGPSPAWPSRPARGPARNGSPACRALGRGRPAAYLRASGHYPRSWIRKGWFHTGFLGHLQRESIKQPRYTLFDRLPVAQRTEIEAMRLAGDFLLWRRLAEHAPLSVMPTVLAGFRFHGSNMSVGGADAYAEEVRATGAPVPHPRLARWAEGAFRKWSALRALDVMREADGLLFTSQGNSVAKAPDAPTPRA